MSFKFTQESDTECNIEGFSTASLSYAWHDFGTNYCNLRNLMDGSGISEQNGYTEETSVDVCMQLDTADCTKY